MNGFGSPSLVAGMVSVDVLLVVFAVAAIVAVVVINSSITIVDNTEKRALTVFGEYRTLLEPGINVVPPFVSEAYRIVMVPQTFDIPPQEAITRDNSAVTASGTITIEVTDAETAFLSVDDYRRATANLVQTTLRAVLGDMDLNEALDETNRQHLNDRIREELEEPLDEWGIRIESVEIKIDGASDAGGEF